MHATEITNATARLPLIDLNHDRREERRQVFRRSRRHGAAILMIVTIGCAVLVPLTQQAAALQHRLRKTKEEARQARTQIDAVTVAGGRLDQKISLWERLVQSQKSRQSWGDFFPTLAACLPPDVLLAQVQIDNKDDNMEMQMQGEASTMTGLRAFTVALAASPEFSHVHLDEAVANHTPGHDSLTFRLTGPVTIGAVSP